MRIQGYVFVTVLLLSPWTLAREIHGPDLSPPSETRAHGLVLDAASEPHALLSPQIEFVNALLDLGVTVRVMTAVHEGPLYDPDTDEIWMPESFAESIAAYFGEDAPIYDVYFHTLLHELGHVLFWHYELPLLSREEDAADTLASVLLLEYVEEGADVLLNAAEMFGLESDDVEWYEAADFYALHSLDIQRYYTTLCHVYGSDPERHEDLINDDYGLSEDRAAICQDEYEQLRAGWLSLLSPFLKQ